MEVARPADDWAPVTIMTTTREIPVPCAPDTVVSVPIPVPEVTVNDLVTVTETVTRSFTFEPEAVDLEPEVELPLDYSRTAAHLVASWLRLAVIGLLAGAGTIIVLRRGKG